MAAIVKANANLAAGGLAVLKRTFSTDREGKLTYSADYVCLSQFTNNHASKFRTGATPPTPLPASVAALQVIEVPTLYDLQTETANGLTYFRAIYVAISNSEASYEITESSEQRSFQGSATRFIQTGSPGFVTINEATDYLSFDYISTSVSASSKNRALFVFSSTIYLEGATPTIRATSLSVQGTVGAPFNIRRSRSYTGGNTVQNAGQVPYEAQAVQTSSSTRNSDGTTTYALTSSGVYVATTPSSAPITNQ